MRETKSSLGYNEAPYMTEYYMGKRVEAQGWLMIMAAIIIGYFGIRRVIKGRKMQREAKAKSGGKLI